MLRSKKHDILSFQGENINIAWAPNGKTIAVGNKEDLVTFIDVRSHKIQREEQFKFEVVIEIQYHLHIKMLSSKGCA